MLNAPTLFVSDLHLHPSRPDTVRLFGAFLAGPARTARALYVLGDLFDAWAGDDDIADPFNAEICVALKATTDAGIALFFLPGNRDFLIGEGFLAATGARLLDDETVVDIAGTPTLLLHGDTLCTDDVAYQDFRSLVRNPDWQHEFLAVPLAERKAKIEALRNRSQAAMAEKSATIMDTNNDAVLAAFNRHGALRIIHGHTHRPALHRYGTDDGRELERWVLPEWHAVGGYLACDTTGCHPLAFPA